MASDYGLNFGFRRSDESNATREGRYKTPVDGSMVLLGHAAIIDGSTGFLKKPVADQDPVTGLTGLLVQEESHLPSIFGTPGPGLGHDSIDLGAAKANQLSVMWGGPSKIWFRNTLAYSRGGRTKAAVTMFVAAGVAVGDKLGWNGTRWAESASHGWMTVTYVDLSVSGAEYCEAVLNF